MHFNTSFYDVYSNGMRSQPHMQEYVFLWLLIFYRSDDGLTDKPRLVTCGFVNCVVRDFVLEFCITLKLV